MTNPHIYYCLTGYVNRAGSSFEVRKSEALLCQSSWQIIVRDISSWMNNSINAAIIHTYIALSLFIFSFPRLCVHAPFYIGYLWRTHVSSSSESPVVYFVPYYVIPAAPDMSVCLSARPDHRCLPVCPFVCSGFSPSWSGQVAACLFCVWLGLTSWDTPSWVQIRLLVIDSTRSFVRSVCRSSIVFATCRSTVRA